MPLKTNLNNKKLNGFNVDVDNLTISYKYDNRPKQRKTITMPFKGSGRNGILNEYEVHAFYENDGTKRKIKQLAIVPKIIRGKIKFYVQFTMEGVAYAKNRHLGEGEVGIDIGTSTIAVVGDEMLSQHILGDNVESCEKKIARIERMMDRSRRATNPQNFNENGTVKKNTKKRKLKWTYSENYKKLRNRIKNLSRKRSDLLKKSHIELANQLLEYGNVFKVEKNDFASMSKRAKEARVDENGKIKSKKRFGKTISNRAPSQFINILENKVKSLGGEFKKVDVKTACTQFDFTEYEEALK